MFGTLRRHPLLRAFLVGLVGVVWAAGVGGSQLHSLLVSHVVCTEHGVVEHVPDRAEAGASSEAGPSIQSADRGAHGEDCGLNCVPNSSIDLLPAPGAVAVVVTAAEPCVLVDAAAPRGPPLAYAPKTSPPAAS
jgi:hypothetical protein